MNEESELQLRDVRHMVKTIPSLDNNYLVEWSKRLGIETLLNKARADA